MKRQDRNFRAETARLLTFALAIGVALLPWRFGFASELSNPYHSLDVQIVARFGGALLAFDSTTNIIPSGQSISVTRLDFLLSDIGLKRADGAWISDSNLVAYVSAREGRTRFHLSAFPMGKYEQIRFHIGLNPELNHHDSSEIPSGDPLNPEVNGLHWAWMGGYVFLAVEGNWIDQRGRQSGYSYHLGTDQHLMSVELPVSLDFVSDSELRLALDVDRIFTATPEFLPHPEGEGWGNGRDMAPQPASFSPPEYKRRAHEKASSFRLSSETSSTHSRTNDPLAAQLQRNLEDAFRFAGASSLESTEKNSPPSRHVEIGPNVTPYRFTMSAFFPQPALPNDNPLTEEGVALGRKLFGDAQLSCNGQQSCASCHNPARGFCERSAISTGAEGKTGTRNAMPLFNLAWKSVFFWDGRALSLREQVLQPIQNPVEMHENLSNVVAKLSRATDEYPRLFAEAFGTTQITPDRIGRALEQFLLTQVSQDSKFDRVLKGQAKFSPEEQRGFELFHTEYDPRYEQFGADCFHCHGGPLFQSQAFANNGLDTEFKDLGRAVVTRKAGDNGKFAVPSLRNIELTGPYMHDGRFKTLEEVVEHYSGGVKHSATLDPNLAKHPDGGVPLSAEDKRDLVTFLKTLTDEKLRVSAEFAKMP